MCSLFRSLSPIIVSTVSHRFRRIPAIEGPRTHPKTFPISHPPRPELYLYTRTFHRTMTIRRIDTPIPFDSNIFLLKGDRNILVDAGTGLGSDTVIRNIRSTLNGENLDMVVLTHCHGDHVCGLPAILEEFGSKAFAYPPDSGWIRDGDRLHVLAGVMDLDVHPVPITDLSNGQVIDIGEHRLRVISTPGHTAGGICLYDEIGHDLISGDTLFAGGVGRTDLPSGSFPELRTSLRNISNIDIRGLYPGHGNCSEQYGSDYVKRGLRLVGDSI